MGRTQFFQHGELALVILALLEQRPMRGFDVMNELDRLFAPRYQASAGSVYPALKVLRSEGLVEPLPDEPKMHRLTRSGRDAVHRRRRMLADIENRTGVHLGPGNDLADAIERFAARVDAVSGRVDPGVVEKVLDAAADEIEGQAGPPATPGDRR